jgi:dienelactone hydrolase
MGLSAVIGSRRSHWRTRLTLIMPSPVCALPVSQFHSERCFLFRYGSTRSGRERDVIMRLVKLVGILALAGVVLGAVGFVYLAVQRSQNRALPAPLGPYAVGRMITTWTDASRQESLGGTPGQNRTLSAWIWYPAEQGGSTVPYMPPEWAHAREADRGFGSIFFQSIDSIQAHATDARPRSEGGPFPVLVLEPGLGLLIPEYTTLAEDLAGRGYVVIGLNPTYSASITVLDGRVIKTSPLGTIAEDATPEQAQQRGDELVAVWAADDRFAIDQAARMNGDGASQFASRLDVHQVGLLGHSFGGAAALQACSLDVRCTAAADVDGSPFGSVVRTGVDRPVLIMSSERASSGDTPELQKANQELASILAMAPHGYQVTIQGARHFNFTDYAVEFHPLLRMVGVVGSIDGTRGLHIASEYLGAFFDRTLKGRPSSILQGPSRDYPEVQITSH